MQLLRVLGSGHLLPGPLQSFISTCAPMARETHTPVPGVQEPCSQVGLHPAALEAATASPVAGAHRAGWVAYVKLNSRQQTWHEWR